MNVFYICFKRYQIFFLLVVLIALAIPPRVYKLTQFPPVIIDEPAYLRDINTLLIQPGFHPATMQWDLSQATLAYYPTIVMRKLGVTDQLFALRFISVLCSLAAIIPFFFLAKQYMSVPIAFCTTLLFSYSYYFLQFSRVGWGVIYATTLGLYLLWIVSSLNEKNYRYIMPSSGIVAAIILYTYRAGEIYIVTSFIFFILKVWCLKQKRQTKITIIFLFISIFFLFSFPWLHTIFTNTQKYMLRANVVSVFHTPLPYHALYKTSDIILYQVLTTIKSWILLLPVQGGGIEDQRYLPNTYPPISPLLIPLFFLGIFFAGKKLKQTWMWFFIFGSGLVFGQIITVDPPNGARALILLPAIYLFCGIALQTICKKYFHNKLIFVLLFLFTVVTVISDWFFYLYWMSWIQV